MLGTSNRPLRPLTILALLLSLASLSAAPVPVDPKAETRVLEGYWADLEKEEPVASRALLGFAARPKEAVAFLKDRLKPLKLSAEGARKLLFDLGSDKEIVWKAAFEELEYFDPRLAIPLTELMNEVMETPARQRMVTVLSGRNYEYLEKHLNTRTVELKKHGNAEVYYNFSSDGGSWWAENKVERLNTGPFPVPKKKWTRAMRAVSLLEFIDTPEATALIETLAEGHPDAVPTREAKDALERIAKKAK